MKKLIISKLFLYRHRFLIGYILLGLMFTLLLFSLPLIAQKDLSAPEIESATNSYYLGKSGIMEGDLVDLPYRLLQKICISLLGLSNYSIKLPSIFVGLLLGVLIILLLNRWFKSNVSLLASCLVVLSTPFLFLAGSGTPLIMIVFWPTLLLWLGSKIQGEKRPKPIYSFVFAIAMLLSIFTPYMIYFAAFCVFFVLFQPHLRFIVKDLPKLPLCLVLLLIVGGLVLLGNNIIHYPATLMELLFVKDFNIHNFFGNISGGLSSMFSWHNNMENLFLSPLISLPIFALALIGLFSTTKGFFASRNSIASLLIVFGVIISGFNSNAIIFMFLPISILVAHGIKYLLTKWYGLFPENPYARISALLPLTVLFGFMIIPQLLHYVYGYRYDPCVVGEFSDNLTVIHDNLRDGVLITDENYSFYKIIERKSDLKVYQNVSEAPDSSTIAILGAKLPPEHYVLSRIITSPKKDNSDIIYLYTSTVKEGE